MIVRSSILLGLIYIYNLLSNPNVQHILNPLISYETGINETTIATVENSIKTIIEPLQTHDMYDIITHRNIDISFDIFNSVYDIIRKVDLCHRQHLLISIANKTLGLLQIDSIQDNDIQSCINKNQIYEV